MEDNRTPPPKKRPMSKADFRRGKARPVVPSEGGPDPMDEMLRPIEDEDFPDATEIDS